MNNNQRFFYSSNVVVSVVIPTYNSAALLIEALDSVIAQTFDKYEIIVIDDGSTDNTFEVVKMYGKRVRYYRIHRSGSSIARWVGVSLSAGKYIASLDADDVWMPEKLEKQVYSLEKNPEMALCYTDGYYWLSNTLISASRLLSALYGQGRNGWQFSFMFKCSAAATSSMLFRRDAYYTVGEYDTKLSYCDAEFLIRLSAFYPFTYIPEPLMAYRVHGNNTSSRVNRKKAVSNLRFLRLIRAKVISKIPDKHGDLEIRLYRNFPEMLQLVMILYWRLRLTSSIYTLHNVWRYVHAILLDKERNG